MAARRLAVFVALLSLPTAVLWAARWATPAAQALSYPYAGLDYEIIRTAQPIEVPGKIEVIQFFWYRCPHCHALEPRLAAWAQGLPADTRLRRVPAILREEWAVDARIFYALDAIGEVDRLQAALYDAVHVQGGKKLKGSAYAQWVADWLATRNVDMQRYQNAYDSSVVRDKVDRARQMSRAFRIDGTPSFAVQGRYLVRADAGDGRTLLTITDFLVRDARRQLSRAQRP